MTYHLSDDKMVIVMTYQLSDDKMVIIMPYLFLCIPVLEVCWAGQSRESPELATSPAGMSHIHY